MPQHPTVSYIRNSSGWSPMALKELWNHRDLLWFNVWREVKAKYRQMALGPIWIVLQPMVQMVVFTFLFSTVARLSSDGDVPYILMVYVAMVPWTFFANASTASVGCLVDQMEVISKIYFPRLIIPLAAILGHLVDFVISFTVFLGIMLGMGFRPGWQALFMPLYLLLTAMTALAVGLWTSSLTVRFRDLRLVVQHGMQVAMFMTPVAYSATEIANSAPNWLWLYQLNPMYWAIEGFRWSMLGIGTPPQPYMIIPISIVLVVLVSGIYMFRRTERNVVDLL